MSATKLFIVALVVIVVIFVVFVLMGPRDKSTVTADNFSPKDYPALGSMNSMLAPFAPKLAAKSLMPPTRTFDLSAAPSYRVEVLPDSSKKFRQAEFSAIPSKHCGLVTYTPADKSGLDKGEPQDSEHSGSKDHPERFSFTVLSSGGTLELKRRFPPAPGPCIYTLQVGK